MLLARLGQILLARAKVSESGEWCGWSGVGKGVRDAHLEGFEEGLRTWQLHPLLNVAEHQDAANQEVGGQLETLASILRHQALAEVQEPV